jgi:hypothetical protein
MTDIQIQFGLMLTLLVVGTIWIIIKGDNDE